MMSPLDPTVRSFDPIEIAPSRAATAEAAGFTLLDDAAGRFIVDREFGVVSLKDQTVLERERGQVHAVRLRVVEPSGACYEFDMRLKLTGLVPQMLPSDDVDALAEPGAAGSWAAFAAWRQGLAYPPLGEETAIFGALVAADANTGQAAPEAQLALGQPAPRPSPRSATWTL